MQVDRGYGGRGVGRAAGEAVGMVIGEAITGAAGEAVGQGVGEGVGVGAGKQNEEACRAHEQLKFKTGLDEAARATH